MTFDIVVAADEDWGIGKDNGLPWPKLRGDLRHFKRTTSTASPGRENAIVMGRKTWESKEVDRRPLPNRRNVVVSRGAYEVPAGVVATRSFEDALAVGGVENVFVVGGAGLILEAVEHAALRYVYLTRVHARYNCDVVIPDLDARGFVTDAWEGALRAEEHDVRYDIVRLVRPGSRAS